MSNAASNMLGPAQASGPNKKGFGLAKSKPHSMESLPYFFYRLALGTEIMKREAWDHTSDKEIRSFMDYIQDKSLRQEAHKYLRKRKFDEHTSSKSIIIKEIAGLYNFGKKLFRYGKMTVNMYMDK